MKKRKKLNLQVKRDLQMWILSRMFFILAISISVALLILYYFSHREIGESFYKAHLTIRHVSDLLLPVILASGGICLLAGLAFALFFPQKIAGPVYRLEQDLKEVSRGNFQKIFRLRRTDRFQSLAEAANEALSKVRYEFRSLKEGLHQAQEALKEGHPEKAQKIMAQLEDQLKRLGFD